MEILNQKGEIMMEITSANVKAFISSVVSWIVIPILIVYGYYLGNEPSQYIVIFYTWILFILQLFVGAFLVLMLVMAGDELEIKSDTLKDKKKIKAILKWNDKLSSKFHSFKMTTSTILHLGLAVLIASTGAIWTAYYMKRLFHKSKKLPSPYKQKNF
jgi:putative Mn2+ efflux pump MntP